MRRRAPNRCRFADGGTPTYTTYNCPDSLPPWTQRPSGRGVNSATPVVLQWWRKKGGGGWRGGRGWTHNARKYRGAWAQTYSTLNRTPHTAAIMWRARTRAGHGAGAKVAKACFAYLPPPAHLLPLCRHPASHVSAAWRRQRHLPCTHTCLLPLPAQRPSADSTCSLVHISVLPVLPAANAAVGVKRHG